MRVDTNELREDLRWFKDKISYVFYQRGDAAADELDANRARIAELEAENAKLRGVIGEIPEGKTCGKCQRLVFPLANVMCELTGDELVDSDIPFSQIDLDNIHKCAACLAAFPNGNKGE